MFVLISVILAVVGAGIVFFAKNSENKSSKFKIFIILAAIYSCLDFWIFYDGLPSLAWPMFGLVGLVLLVWWVTSCLVSSFTFTEGYYSDGDWQNITWIPIIYLVLLIVVTLSGWSIFGSSRYANLIGNIEGKTQKHWSQDIQPLDPTHIRLVPKELAISLAKTTLSQDGVTLGSQFPLDESHTTLQKINNDYWYLIPLDFKSWTVWTKADGVPAYVKISATDPYAKPNLVTGKKMKYTPGAFFGDNLERKLYLKYMSKVLTDFSFEEDDHGKVYWVITVCNPIISFWGITIEGVVILDPETGTDEYVSKSQIENDSKYNWVDRVMPVGLIKSYIDDWGTYKGGWWNQAWDHVNLLEAETPTLNYSSDGRCVIVTPVTSNNSNDVAMTGLMYTDARTGKSVYYAVSGGASEQAVIDAVNSAISYKKWHASEQIVYENVYGKLSALIPILGANGNYQGLAIVKNENKQVAVGATPSEALIELQKMLMSDGGQISIENNKDVLEYTGKIARLGWDISGSNSGKQYYLYFSGFNNSFMISSKMQSELSLTKEGDEIYIKYIKSDQISVPVMEFKNLTLNLQKGKNEESVTTQISVRKEENQVKADIKDFKEEVKNMSDEDLKKLMKK